MKPIVHYVKGSNTEISKGLRVTLQPVDHTSSLVSNECFALTSVVQEVWGDGVFETMNSRYVPTAFDEGL